LKETAFPAKDLKGEPDEDNPLYPSNHVHFRLKHFLDSHSGFDRDDLQGYLDRFAFLTNPPDGLLSKVDILINDIFGNPVQLRFRGKY
jgi:hypothetical protein